MLLIVLNSRDSYHKIMHIVCLWKRVQYCFYQRIVTHTAYLYVIHTCNIMLQLYYDKLNKLIAAKSLILEALAFLYGQDIFLLMEIVMNNV